MSQLPVDGASCDAEKKTSKFGHLCPAVAMVRSVLHLSAKSIDFKGGRTVAIFLMESVEMPFYREFPWESYLKGPTPGPRGKCLQGLGGSVYRARGKQVSTGPRGEVSARFRGRCLQGPGGRCL